MVLATNESASSRLTPSWTGRSARLTPGRRHHPGARRGTGAGPIGWIAAPVVGAAPLAPPHGRAHLWGVGGAHSPEADSGVDHGDRASPA